MSNACGSRSDEVVVTVQDNRPPVVASAIPALEVAGGAEADVNVSGRFHDPDRDHLTYTASSADTTVATARVSGSVVTVRGVSRGASEISVTASDGRGGSVEQKFTATVLNSAPTAVGEIAAQTVVAGSSGSVDVTGHFADRDGDAVTLTATSSDTTVARASAAGGEVTYEGVSEGDAEITVTADDGHGGTAEQRFSLSVHARNHPPLLSSSVDLRTLHLGGAGSVDASQHVVDPDGDPLTYDAVSSDTTLVTVQVSDSLVSYQAVSRGEAEVTVTASDGRGGSVDLPFRVTVANRAPEANGRMSDLKLQPSARAYRPLMHRFADADGDSLSYAAVSSDSTRALAWIRGATVVVFASRRGNVELVVTADDGHGGTAEQRFDVTVRNRAPIGFGSIAAQAVVTGRTVPVVVSGNFVDGDGDTLTYKAVSSDAAVAAVAVRGDTVDVRGVAAGSAEVTVTADDGHGGTAERTFAVQVEQAANQAPSFAEEAYRREVAENSDAGTRAGDPVTADDPEGTPLTYRLVGDGFPFGVDAGTGQLAVATGAELNYESGDTLFAVVVEASDGELADTTEVRVRVRDADDPGIVRLRAPYARVHKAIFATLADEDSPVPGSVNFEWQVSRDSLRWTTVAGGPEPSYRPAEADAGQWLRALVTYADRHGPAKKVWSRPVSVIGVLMRVASFAAEAYQAAANGSADVAVMLSPAASAELAVRVEARDTVRTVMFQAGDSARTLEVGTAGLSASDTVVVRFGSMTEGVMAGSPAETRIVVMETAGGAAVPGSGPGDEALVRLEVGFGVTEYDAVVGGPATEVALRMAPAADRRVAVPLTVERIGGVAMDGRALAVPHGIVPDTVVFEPGDSLVAFPLALPAATAAGRIAIGLGELPEAVSAGDAAATVEVSAPADQHALHDEAFDVGLAVLGRAVAEGAGRAVGARIDAVMRPGTGSRCSAVPGSANEWAGRTAGMIASLTGAQIGGNSQSGSTPRADPVQLPTVRQAADRLLPRVSFATALGTPQTAGAPPRFGLWAEGSAQGFRGEPDGMSYDGGLRALTVGADARVGSSALVGLSVMRSDGDLDYGHGSASSSLGHTMNSVHPYLFVQPSPRIGLWAMAGYGGGDLSDADQHATSHAPHDATLRMLSGGVRVPLARRGAFGLALNGDAFAVAMRADGGVREGAASRARALLEASWTAHGLKVAARAGARHDGGDADTGAGAETGGSLSYTGRGLDLALDGRLALGSGGHREWGTALRLAFDPGTPGEGFRLSVRPARGHDRSDIHGLIEGGRPRAIAGTARVPVHDRPRDWRLDAEAGYAFKAPGGGAFDAHTRLSTAAGSSRWSLGTHYGLGPNLRLTLEGSRHSRTGQPGGLALRVGADLGF